MRKIFALLATLVLGFSLSSFAQTADRPAGNNTDATTANQTDNSPHHDYGWIGLLGLAGLAGLMGRRRGVTENRDRGVPTDIRRAA